jgi:hypothetical protein
MDYGQRENVEKHDDRNWTAEADDDPNHFDPRYFGEDKKYHYPRVEEDMLPSMRRAYRRTADTNTEILNAGIGGKLEAFPRVEFRDLFEENQEAELALFLDAMDITPAGKTLPEVFPDATEISSPDEFDESAEVLISPVETATQLIDSVIETHIPFGPFNEQFVFRKRTAGE